jgi:peptidoglycan hydrolase-like amidase
MVTVTEQEDSFTIESRRFGHGVGLSQRGAQWMAGTYQKTFTEILAFYYPGMSLMRVDTAQAALPAVTGPLSETAGPCPRPRRDPP